MLLPGVTVLLGQFPSGCWDGVDGTYRPTVRFASCVITAVGLLPVDHFAPLPHLAKDRQQGCKPAAWPRLMPATA